MPTPQFLSTQAHKIHKIVRQVPAAILHAAKRPPQHVPSQLARRGSSASLRRWRTTLYAVYDPSGAQGKGDYELLWIDAMGSPHETGSRADLQQNEEVQEVIWWKHSKWDWRICGPAGQVFPRPDGWLLGDKEVKLYELSVREYTNELTIHMRKFRPPACEAAWDSRLNAALPWKKIWRIRSIFATPRDQLTGLKLLHRNLYVGKREQHDKSCRACTEEEFMLHLCECGVIMEEYTGLK